MVLLSQVTPRYVNIKQLEEDCGGNKMQAGVCSICVDDEYERVGVGDDTEEIHNHVSKEYEPEETYIIPNAVPVDQHHETPSSCQMSGENQGF